MDNFKQVDLSSRDAVANHLQSFEIKDDFDQKLLAGVLNEQSDKPEHQVISSDRIGEAITANQSAINADGSMVPTEFDSRITFSNPAPGSRSKVVSFDGFASNDQSHDVIL